MYGMHSTTHGWGAFAGIRYGRPALPQICSAARPLGRACVGAPYESLDKVFRSACLGEHPEEGGMMLRKGKGKGEGARPRQG